jgi:hypothetical protein
MNYKNIYFRFRNNYYEGSGEYYLIPTISLGRWVLKHSKINSYTIDIKFLCFKVYGVYNKPI